MKEYFPILDSNDITINEWEEFIESVNAVSKNAPRKYCLKIWVCILFVVLVVLLVLFPAKNKKNTKRKQPVKHPK